MRFGVLFISVFALLLISPLYLDAHPGGSTPIENGHKAMQVESFGKMPLCFIKNERQMPREVEYYVRGSDKNLFFSRNGITIALKSLGQKARERWTTKLDFMNANKQVRIFGEDPCKGQINYFKGKPEEWNTGIPTFGKIVYKDLWPGIDLVYSGTMNRLKYEFRVNPGADPDQIRLTYRGVSRLSLGEEGALVVQTPSGCFEDGVPFAYQRIDGQEKEIPMSYSLAAGNDQGDRFSYGFQVGDYDSSIPLVLDPVIMVFCGYIGGDLAENGLAITLDDAGYIYVVGYADSEEDTFPVEVGPDLTYNVGKADGFIAKIDPKGDDLIYCGYIGGAGDDLCESVAVDSAGNAYVCGMTNTDETTFPVTVGPDLTYNGGARDAFVAKVNSAGTGLVYCGYIGGDDKDEGWDMGVDSAGHLYVYGCTLSSESTFPVVVGPGLTYGGGTEYGDTWVAKVSITGSSLDYCGYIGGTGEEWSASIAVDNSGCAYVNGFTRSHEDSFPVVVGPDLTFNGGDDDAFIAKVASTGANLVYCGYIGGTGWDESFGMALDSEGNAYITGFTRSDETSFPVSVGPDLTFNGVRDAYVARINSAGTGLDFCGYIGGDDYDAGRDLAIDGAGNIYITGRTYSTETSFPVTMGPDLTFNGYDRDAFVAKIDSTATTLDYCGFIGGIWDEWGTGIVSDELGNVFVVGTTYSGQSSFPVTVGPDLTINGSSDLFVAKISMSLVQDSDAISVSTGGTVNLTLNAGADNAGRWYLMLGTMSGSSPGMPLPNGGEILPIKWDAFTDYMILRLNGPVFSNFLAPLDSYGQSAAQLVVPALNPSKIGKVMTYAFCLDGAPDWDFASDPVEITLEP